MDELKQLKSLYQLSFDDSKEYIDNFFETKVDLKNVVMIKKEDKILSALHLVDKHICLRGALYLCPFVVAAATLPELRGQKLLEPVMTQAFNKLIASSTFFTALYPFKHSYYTKYGFVTYTFVKKHLVKGVDSLGIFTKKAAVDDIEELLNIYNKFCINQNGYVERNKKIFENLISEWQIDNNDIYIIYYKNIPVAYFIYGKEIEEFCGQAKYIDCVAFLKGKYVQLINGKIEYDMIRIVDPINLLKSIKFDHDGECSFKLVDNFYPRNNGVFNIKIKDGKAEITKCDKYSIEFNIDELTKLVFGQKNICGDSLNNMLRPIKTFCFDKF